MRLLSPPGARPWLQIGVVLAVAYVAVAALTAALGPRGARPLFDGFAPPVPYRWVDPPPEAAADNRPPDAMERTVEVGPAGSAISTTATADGQAVVVLEAGSVPPSPPEQSPPDSAVRVRITPVDPSTLAPLAPGLRPAGNAYAVDVAYLPSERAVTSLAKPGDVAFVAATSATVMLFSADGTSWAEVPASPYGQHYGLQSKFQTTGFYLVAGPGQPDDGDGGGGSGGRLVLLVLLGLVPLALAFLLLRRRPSAQTSGGRPGNPVRRPPARPKPAAKGGKSKKRPPPRRRK